MAFAGSVAIAGDLLAAIRAQQSRLGKEVGDKILTHSVKRDEVVASIGQISSVSSNAHAARWAVDARMGRGYLECRVRLLPVLTEADLELERLDPEEFLLPSQGRVYVPLVPGALEAKDDGAIECALMLVYPKVPAIERRRVPDEFEADGYVAAVDRLCAFARGKGYLVPADGETDDAWVARDELVWPDPGAPGRANPACLVRATYSPATNDTFTAEAAGRTLRRVIAPLRA